MIHGGNILSYQQLYAGRIIDYSSNINPLGPPKGLKEALFSGYDEIVAYPDIEYRHLKKSIGEYLGCRADEVVLGNGAVEIIDNIIALFNRIIVATPCFSEYIKRAEVKSKDVIKVSFKNDFSLDLDRIEQNIKKGDLVILGNPNNPTGRRVNKEELILLHNIVCGECAFLLLDEAFYEFCPEDYDSIMLFHTSKNICIIRAATKFFALPGIRLGYAFCSPEFAEKYNELALPWNINMFANIAGQYIFNNLEYISATKEYIKVQREYLLSELKKINSIEVFTTRSNFILIKLLMGNEEEIFEFMIAYGIMLRKASSFEGLDNSYIRIAVKSYEDNKYLIDCFNKYDKYCVDKTNISR